MTRRTQLKSSLTTTATTAQQDRVAKRLARQTKQLHKEMSVVSYMPTESNALRNRSINLKNLKQIEPMTEMQREFFEAYEDGGEAFILYGSPGTGKSYLAIYNALVDVLSPDSVYKKLIIVRACVSSREIGHLPGLDEKWAPYTLPYISICADLFGRPDAYEKLVEMGKIEFLTTSFLRSITLNDCIIVADEIQNETFSTIGTLITRTGKNSKLIIMGDGLQNDLVKSKYDQSGFSDFMRVSKQMYEFQHFKFTSADIVRSGICKSWIIATEKLGLQ